MLANPAGPEPASEWIEVVNDSARTASLADVWLEDSGGHARLPEGELAPGEIVLLVGADFRESGLDDADPADDATLGVGESRDPRLVQ